MRIVCIADTHEKHAQVKLPEGDILIHAGDFTWVGDPKPTLDFLDWAFMGTPEILSPIWAKIPKNLDILITHGPPFGILDRTIRGVTAGCSKLLEAVQLKAPRIHVFGHIHEGYGMLKKNGTAFVNASLCSANYDLMNKPVVIDL